MVYFFNSLFQNMINGQKTLVFYVSSFSFFLAVCCVKVCLYRTRPRLSGVRERMTIDQTKVVYTERERGTRL